MPKEPKTKDIDLEIIEPDDLTAKSANHFVFSYSEDEFVLDIVYVNPRQIALALDGKLDKLKGRVINRIGLTHKNMMKLRGNIDEILGIYSGANK